MLAMGSEYDHDRCDEMRRIGRVADVPLGNEGRRTRVSRSNVVYNQIGYFGEPEEIGKSVEWLCLERASFVTASYFLWRCAFPHRQSGISSVILTFCVGHWRMAGHLARLL
jgi:NAD(P)-dependent dehydrogenase (short-subunit alcohol dehydrogenase family)